MLRTALIVASLSILILSPCRPCPAEEKNLLDNPSFEVTIPKNQFGHVLKSWGGWKYEGDCDFRVGQIARTGKRSCLLFGGATPKIRTSQLVELQPGRYKTTAYLRGLDIGTGIWNNSTEFMFADKYMSLKKNGTFGWTKLTYVGEITKKGQAGPSFGLWAPGYFWIDDVLAGQGGQRRAADPGAGAGRGGSAHRAAGRFWARRRALRGVRLQEHAPVENVLRLRHAAGGEAGGRHRPGHEVDYLVRRQEPLRERHDRPGPCHRRHEGPADRQGLHRHAPAAGLARLRFPRDRRLHRFEGAHSLLRGVP